MGAISGVKNPILVAQRLVEEQQKGLLPLGRYLILLNVLFLLLRLAPVCYTLLLPSRVPPGFLVGEGAREWAIRHNIQTVKTETLISDKAAKLYR